jgi:hypothetical protein
MDKADTASIILSLRQQSAATLAAAIISAMGWPVSVQEALDIQTDLDWGLHPSSTSGIYKEWEKNRDQALGKVRK